MSTSSILIFAAWAVLFALAFFGLGFFVRRKTAEAIIGTAEERARQMRESAMKEGDRIVEDLRKETERQLAKLRHDFEERQEARRRELEESQRGVELRERTADRKLETAQQREAELRAQGTDIERARAEVAADRDELEKLIIKERESLSRVSGLSPEDAKRQLLKRMEVDIRAEASILIKAVEEETKEMAERKAKNI